MRERRTNQLFGLLRRIQQILSEGRRSLRGSEADRWKVLALARWEMLRALGRLNRCKKIYLLDPLRLHGSEELTRRARRLVEHNFELLHDYQRFVEHWSLTSPSSVDQAYRAEALQMGDRIERQMEEDGRELDALIAQADDLAQAAPARKPRSTLPSVDR